MISIELRILAWGCLLALIHIFAAAQIKTKQYGTKWNMGARDEDLPPPSPLVGRPRIERQNPEGRQRSARRDQQRCRGVHALADTLAAKQHHAQHGGL